MLSMMILPSVLLGGIIPGFEAILVKLSYIRLPEFVGKVEFLLFGHTLSVGDRNGRPLFIPSQSFA